MAKKGKKRDIKIGLNTDFENAMRIALSQQPEKMDHKDYLKALELTEKTFTLNKGNPTWPGDTGKVSSKNYTAIEISGTANATFIFHYNIGLSQWNSMDIIPELNNALKTRFILAVNTLFYFELKDKENSDTKCKITFHLLAE